jgi:hypothetical protein
MNKYEYAISLGNQKQFLLGRGEYFVINRDYGTHDTSNTIYFIFEYLKTNQENYNQLDGDLIEILSNEFLSTFDLTQLLNIIWSYFTKKSDNQLQKTWVFSDTLILLLNSQIKKHIELKTELGSIKWYVRMLNEKFGFKLDTDLL